MNINIKGTTIALTPAITDYVEKRLESVKKLLGNDTAIQCDVEVGKTTEHHKHGDIFRAEVHIVGNGHNIYVTADKSDLYSAIDDVRDEVARQITTTKGKKISLARRGGMRIKQMMRGVFGRNGEASIEPDDADLGE